MSLREVASTLERAGYRRIHETAKVVEFVTASGQTIYLINGSGPHLVIPEQVATAIPSNIQLGDRKRYHNSNLRAFDLRRNGGQKPIHYGVSVKPESDGDFARFL